MRILDLTPDERKEIMDDVLAYAHRTGDYSRFDDVMNQAWDEVIGMWEQESA